MDFRYRFKKLRFIGIAQGFFEVMDYGYRFSTEWFIVPITATRSTPCAITNSLVLNYKAISYLLPPTDDREVLHGYSADH